MSGLKGNDIITRRFEEVVNVHIERGNFDEGAISWILEVHFRRPVAVNCQLKHIAAIWGTNTDLSFLMRDEVQVESRSVVSLIVSAKLLPPWMV